MPIDYGSTGVASMKWSWQDQVKNLAALFCVGGAGTEAVSVPEVSEAEWGQRELCILNDEG